MYSNVVDEPYPIGSKVRDDWEDKNHGVANTLVDTSEIELPYSSANDDVERPIYNNKVGKELENDDAPLAIEEGYETEHDPIIYLSIPSRQANGRMGNDKNDTVQKRQWRQVMYYDTSFIVWKD